MENRLCPYCGSENWEWMGNEYEPQKYHCHECDWWFGDDDVTREDIRHKISAILMDTDEDNQMKCEICIENKEACGLSTLEMDWIDSCFQIPGDGTIWFHYHGYDNFITGEKEYKNFDDIDTKDLQTILEELTD